MIDEPLDAEGRTDPEDGAFNLYEEAFANLAMNVDIPDKEGTDNLELCELYQMSVNAIKQNVNVAYENSCMVCNGEHCFKNCDTLNNSAFLRQHYIRFCQNVRKDQAALTAGQGGNRPSNTSVHYLDTGRVEKSYLDTYDFPMDNHYCNRLDDLSAPPSPLLKYCVVVDLGISYY